MDRRFMHAVRTDDGQHLTHRSDIRQHAVNFYKELYKCEYTDNEGLLCNFHQGLPKVSPEDNAELQGPLVLEELQAALSTMAGGKAPGIDGPPVEFYKFFWQELGEDLLEVLQPP